MNRNFGPPNGRGRGFPPAAYGMPSPGPNYRLPPGAQPRPGPNMGPQFQQQMPPGSPYSRGRNSPALPHGQPSMPPQHMAPNPQMAYGGYPQMGGQGHPVSSSFGSIVSTALQEGTECLAPHLLARHQHSLRNDMLGLQL
jgi:hypothetical protein